MNKCCRTCRNYNDGRCYSDAFETNITELPEVYIQIDPDDLNEAIKQDDLKLKYDDVVTIASNARYVAEYEYEKQEIEKKGIAIKDSSEFYCCKYR